MDPKRFDALPRALGAAVDRRQAVKGALAGVLAGAAAARGLAGAGADAGKACPAKACGSDKECQVDGNHDCVCLRPAVAAQAGKAGGTCGIAPAPTTTSTTTATTAAPPPTTTRTTPRPPTTTRRPNRCPGKGLAGQPCDGRCKCANDRRCHNGRCCETRGDGSVHCNSDSDCCPGLECARKAGGRHKTCLPKPIRRNGEAA